MGDGEVLRSGEVEPSSRSGAHQRADEREDSRSVAEKQRPLSCVGQALGALHRENRLAGPSLAEDDRSFLPEHRPIRVKLAVRELGLQTRLPLQASLCELDVGRQDDGQLGRWFQQPNEPLHVGNVQRETRLPLLHRAVDRLSDALQVTDVDGEVARRIWTEAAVHGAAG